MGSRFTFGGDEHLLVECADEMSMRSFFKSLSAAQLIKKSPLVGLDEINAGNASYLIKFNPDFIKPAELLSEIKKIDRIAENSVPVIEPKYLRPRTDTPRHTIGHGGCFACIYAVQGAGGYQMFGVTPVPIFDPLATHSHIDESMVFFRPGDIVKFRAISSHEYDAISADVRDGIFSLKTIPVEFDLREFEENSPNYNRALLDKLDGS